MIIGGAEGVFVSGIPAGVENSDGTVRGSAGCTGTIMTGCFDWRFFRGVTLATFLVTATGFGVDLATTFCCCLTGVGLSGLAVGNGGGDKGGSLPISKAGGKLIGCWETPTLLVFRDATFLTRSDLGAEVVERTGVGVDVSGLIVLNLFATGVVG